MKKSICCIFNVGPHYRSTIYKLMDTELNCDFYFGDKVDTPIKLMDYNSLKGYKDTFKNIRIPKTGFIWQKKAWRLVFKPYKHYIITGSPGSLSNWVIVLFSHILGKKVHAWTHGMKGKNTTFGKFIAKRFYQLCHTILLYGDYSKAVMLREGFKEKKLIPIYNSLDYPKQLEVRKKLVNSDVYKELFKNDDPVLIYIGRIQKSKKIDLLIEAIKILRSQGTNCNLNIIGEDIDGSDISNMVKEYDLEGRVNFYGPSYDEQEVGKLMYNSDLCVTPGLIGLTAIHALTYGVPVVTSDTFAQHGPEFEAIKAGVTGDFFENGNVNDLCDKISNWITIEDKRRELIRRNAFDTIDEKYNPFYQVNLLKNLTSK